MKNYKALRINKKSPCVSLIAAGKFADEGRRADGGLRNGEFFTLVKTRRRPFYRRQAATPQTCHRAAFFHLFTAKKVKKTRSGLILEK